eukprot:1140245-Pelagomonas_calceolata.AAC.1
MEIWQFPPNALEKITSGIVIMRLLLMRLPSHKPKLAWVDNSLIDIRKLPVLPMRGTVLTAWRLLRCSPLGSSGYDPPSWIYDGHFLVACQDVAYLAALETILQVVLHKAAPYTCTMPNIYLQKTAL